MCVVIHNVRKTQLSEQDYEIQSLFNAVQCDSGTEATPPLLRMTHEEATPCPSLEGQASCKGTERHI